MTSGVLDIIRQARRPRRSVALCIRGDLVARYEALERQLAEARERDSRAFTGGEARDLAAQMDELQQQMKAATLVFWMQALPRLRPISLLAEHAPRDGNDQDKRLGYNPDTFYPAMIRESCYAVTKPGEPDPEPTLDGPDPLPDEDWSGLFDALSHQQFDRMFAAAWTLNNDDVAVPTSALASLISRANGESSKQPGRGESPPARFAGWEPTWITEVIRDTEGRVTQLMQTMAQPEWDAESRRWALALQRHDVEMCPCGCGFPSAVSQAPDGDGAFIVPPPTRCHARTALIQAQTGYSDSPQPAALLFHVDERERPARG